MNPRNPVPSREIYGLKELPRKQPRPRFNTRSWLKEAEKVKRATAPKGISITMRKSLKAELDLIAEFDRYGSAKDLVLHIIATKVNGYLGNLHYITWRQQARIG